MAKKRERNVNVVIRVRPEMPSESLNAQHLHLQCSEKDVILKQIEKRVSLNSIYKKFSFDRVYSQLSSQQLIFEKTVEPIINEVIQGFNCTIFAYGQTGTGKTYTIEGDVNYNHLDDANHNVNETKLNDGAGIIPRAVMSIFQRLSAQKTEFSSRISFLELYNEELIDLLDDKEKPLRIFEDGKNGISVHNLSQLVVQNPSDIFSALKKGVEKRHTAETKMNRNSSRSHCVFTLTVHMKESGAEGEDIVKIGTLNLVDLAGAECVGRSGAVKGRAKEAGMINTSLLTLGRVVTALVDRLPYVPYRDSKLTRLLQESLGGRAKTVIIATVSPFADEETLSTLEYANRAKNVLNKPEINQKLTSGKYLREVTQKLLDLQRENECLRKEHGIFLPEDKFNRMMCENRFLQEKSARLNENLNAKVKENNTLSESLKHKRKEISFLREDLDRQQNELKSQAKEMEKYRISLQMSENNAREQRVLLNAFRTNEKRLLGAARELKGMMRSVSSDNTHLCDKIEKKESIEVGNDERLNGLKEYFSQKIDCLHSQKNALKELNCRSAEAFRSVYKNMTEKGREAVVEIKKEAEEMISSERIKNEDCKAHLLELEFQNRGALKTFSSKVEGLYGPLFGEECKGKSLAEAVERVKGQTAAIKSKSSILNENTKKKVEECLKGLKVLENALNDFLEDCKSTFDDLLTSSKNFCGEFARESAEAKAVLRGMKAEAFKTGQNAIERLTAAIKKEAELIEGERHSKMETVLTEAIAAMDGIEQTSEKWAEETDRKAEISAEKASAFNVKQNESIRRSVETNSSIIKDVEENEREMTVKTAEIATGMEEFLDFVAGTVLSGRLQARELSERVEKQWNLTADKLKGEMTTEKHFRKFLQLANKAELLSPAKKLLEKAEGLARDLEVKGDETLKDFSKLNEEMRRRLTVFFTSEILSYAKTGMTPRKKWVDSKKNREIEFFGVGESVNRKLFDQARRKREEKENYEKSGKDSLMRPLRKKLRTSLPS